jgi:hypothetical protein
MENCMTHMIATKDFTYASGGLRLKAGDKFFTVGPNAERDAKWLDAWGKAKYFKGVAEAPSDGPSYLRKDEVAEDTPAVRVKRKYKRRDMSTTVSWLK